MRKYLIHNGTYYIPQYLTQDEICDIIKTTYDQPVLNADGEMLTSIDLDWSEE